ncbi:hypothetical protein [Alteromonas sp.]|uniref:PglD-related sugar-binding protein n=1 Tax=Alteromonas sp. TaxID=232 RepID=UPI0035159C5B
MNSLAIFGTGGFAREVYSVAIDCGFQNFVFIKNDEVKLSEFCGCKVVSQGEVADLAHSNFKFAIGIASPMIKKRIYKEYEDLNFCNLVHPTVVSDANFKDFLTSKKGVIIAANVVLMLDAYVDDFVTIGTQSSIGHNSIINMFSSLMPNVTISGFVKVCSSSFIGASATVLQGDENAYLTLESNCIVGAASLINRNVDAGTTVFGIPAKRKKID